jgi:putative SOS response-associated peptidase YedK
MCGRFTNKLTWEEIVALYRLRKPVPPHNLPPRYNICPTDPVDVVTEHDGKRDFGPMRWGLVPYWWSKPLKELRAATFNARAETVADKPFSVGHSGAPAASYPRPVITSGRTPPAAASSRGISRGATASR